MFTSNKNVEMNYINIVNNLRYYVYFFFIFKFYCYFIILDFI